jgi:hypothetical protein
MVAIQAKPRDDETRETAGETGALPQKTLWLHLRRERAI